MYTFREIDLPAKFLTTQSAGNIVATRPQMPDANGNTRDTFASQFAVKSASIQNRSSGTPVIGFGGRLPIALWEAGLWDDSEYAAGTVGIDDTADAQDADAGDFVLDVVGINNDGFFIASDIPFNIVSIIVSQASTAITVWAAYYSKTSGGTGFSSNYATFANMLVAPSLGATGEQLVWFNEPADWVPTSTATAVANKHGAGIPAGKYVLVVKSTTAPNITAGLATLLMLGKMAYSTEAVADNAVYLKTGDEGETPIPPQCDALCAAISLLTNVQSRASLTYRMVG